MRWAGLALVLVAAVASASIDSKAAKCAGEQKGRCGRICGRVVVARAERAATAGRDRITFPRDCETYLLPPGYEYRVDFFGAGEASLWRAGMVPVVKDIRTPGPRAVRPPPCAPVAARPITRRPPGMPAQHRSIIGGALFVERRGGGAS